MVASGMAEPSGMPLNHPVLAAAARSALYQSSAFTSVKVLVPSRTKPNALLTMRINSALVTVASGRNLPSGYPWTSPLFRNVSISVRHQ